MAKDSKPTTWNPASHPDAPLKWRKPRRVRVNLTGTETDRQLDRMFAVMALASDSTFEVLAGAGWLRDYLTKPYMPGRVCDVATKQGKPLHKAETIRHDDGEYRKLTPVTWPLPNVAIGTTCRTQAEVDHAVPILLSMPNAGPWLRLEPVEAISVARLIGPWKDCPHYANFSPYSSPVGTTSGTGEGGCTRPENVFADSGNPTARPGAVSCRPDGCPFGYIGRLHLIELSGQTGTDAKPLHPDWARSIRDECKAAGVPFRFESWGQWVPYDDDHWPASFARDDVRDRDRTKFFGDAEMYPAGPRRSGRVLDGVTHDGQIEFNHQRKGQDDKGAD